MIRKMLLLLILIPVIALTGCVSQQEPTGNEVQTPAREPDKEQIQADLIGSHFRWGEEGSWYFAALSEFESVTINEKTLKGTALEFDVILMLKEFELGKHFTMDVFLVYKKNDNKWQLTSYLVKDFREMVTQTD
jgi:hypothetical protein